MIRLRCFTTWPLGSRVEIAGKRSPQTNVVLRASDHQIFDVNVSGEFRTRTGERDEQDCGSREDQLFPYETSAETPLPDALAKQLTFNVRTHLGPGMARSYEGAA